MSNEETLSPQQLPSAVSFLEKSPVRYSAAYTLELADYMTYNTFIFESTGILAKNRSRMKYMGIAELLAGLAALVAAFFVGDKLALFLFLALVLMAGGVLTTLYYPVIFPKQFEKSIRQSYAESGYMGKTMRVDFHDDGFVERTDEPCGALWEDVQGFFETDTLALLLMEQQQAVVIPKSAFGEEYEAFRQFCEDALDRAHTQK